MANDRPARYSIEGLLAGGAQPLADFDRDELDALRKSLGKGPLAVPVCVSGDGILLDGHQRLKALLAQGRKYIDASDVRIVEEADKDNALEYAVRLNVQRRHLSVQEKAGLARRMQAQYSWPMARIAKAFGVSRPAVAQWLTAHPAPPGSAPATVIGQDGRKYKSSYKGDADDPTPPKPPEPKSPWRTTEPGYKALARARKLLEANPSVVGLSPIQRARLGELVNDLREALDALDNEIAEAS